MTIDLGAVPITGFISPTDNTDDYATHKDVYGKGGYRAVDDLDALNAISLDRRQEGMLVYVLSEKSFYQLLDGIDNTNWVLGHFLGELPEDYIFKGNDLGVAEASPALIDIGLDIIDLNTKVDSLIVSSGELTKITGAVVGEGYGTIETTLTDITTSQISDFDDAVTANSLDQFQIPESDLDIGGNLIHNVGEGVDGTDVANINFVEGYVDTAIVNDTIKSVSGTNGQIVITGTTREPVIGLIKTSVTSGSFTNINATVDDYGRLTSVSNGSGGGGGVTSITAGTGITVTGTTTPTVGLTKNGVSLSYFSVPTASISMGSQIVTNVAESNNLNDAANMRAVIKNLYSGYCCTATNNSVTNVLIATTPQKLNGNTATFALTNFTSSGNNILTYNDTSPYTDTRTFEIVGGATITSSVANITLYLEIYRNGSLGSTAPIFPVRITASGVPFYLPLMTVVSLTNGSYIEMFITSSTNATITATNYGYKIRNLGT